MTDETTLPGIPFPVETDPRMPKDTFLIQADAARTRVFFAPVGATYGDETGWTEVGTMTDFEWDTVEAPGPTPVETLTSTFRWDETITLNLEASPPARDQVAYKRLPDAAPVDVWDVLLGEDFKGSRIRAHRDAMTALSALCGAASGVTR